MDERLRIKELELQIEKMREALEEISKGEGAFSRDPLEHAGNCIQHMKDTAQEALSTPSSDYARKVMRVVNAARNFNTALDGHDITSEETMALGDKLTEALSDLDSVGEK